MSVLSTVVDPAAAVVVTGIIGFVAHRLGMVKIGSTTLAQDVAKDWPEIKAVADKVDPLAAQIPAVQTIAENAAKDAANANAALSKATDGISAVVEAEVKKQFGSLLANLSHPVTQPVPVVTPETPAPAPAAPVAPPAQ